MSHNKSVGNYGEKVAAHYLIRKGHTIICQNLRLKTGEIDLLSFKDTTLYLNEVKTSTLNSPVLPEDNLSKTKLSKLRSLAAELDFIGYTRNSFMNNNLQFQKKPNIKDIVVSGVCVYITFNSLLKENCVIKPKRIVVKYFENLFLT